VSGLFGAEPIDQLATWVCRLATLVVLGGMLGERRFFGWSQHLLAGLATGYLALLAITEVIVPRLVEPLATDPGGRPELVVGLGLVAVTAATPWLPRIVGAFPLSIAIGHWRPLRSAAQSSAPSSRSSRPPSPGRSPSWSRPWRARARPS
jgi:hypothetical protein